VVYLAIDVDGIHPDKVICLDMPFHVLVKFLLADRTWGMQRGGISGHPHVFIFRFYLGSSPCSLSPC
jgi:hypothetical protein